MVEFQVVGGTVMGREHYRMRANRQDAFRIERLDGIAVAVVCDGCGDPASPHSEVGAVLGARTIAHRLSALLAADEMLLSTQDGMEKVLERVRRDTLVSLRKLARTMGEDPEEAICDCFLFTVVGCAIGETHAAFFALGDGAIIANGVAIVLGPYENNAPPYLAYGLLGKGIEQHDLGFKVHRHLRTSELDNFLIGTDGVCDLIKDDGQTLPGTTEPIGGVEMFWHEAIHFSNPHALGNRLRLINTDQVRIDWQSHRKTTDWGRLADDTTLVVGRRSG